MTIKDRQRVCDMYLDGVTVKKICSEIGVANSTVYDILRTCGIKPARGKGRQKLSKEYAVYDKDDNYLTQGTAEECSEYLGVKRNTFYTGICRQRKGRRRRYYIVELDSEE